ncbi:MAG: terminase, partial [Terriglobales bacterium]
PGDAAATLASLRAAVPPHGEVVLESTPNGAGGCFYDEWQRAEETGAERHFFPWWWEAEYAQLDVKLGRLTEEERELVTRHGLSHAQIAYRREVRANFRGLAPQEFAEDAHTCFLASRNCVFDVEAVERRMVEVGEPSEARDHGRLLIFWPPAKERSYIVGVDPAGGGAEGDYAVAEVIDRESGMQCAELRGHFTPAELAAGIASLAREYNQGLVAVERNNHGHGVIAHLTTVRRYANLFSKKGELGWATTAVTRPSMLENFAAILVAAPELFWSRWLLEECRTFVRQADGSSRAASGAHDDCIFAMAIALGVRKEQAGTSRSGTVEVGSLPVR